MKRHRKRLAVYILFVTVLTIVSIFTGTQTEAEQGEGETVYIVPIEREVERGLEAFIDRATTEAMESGADHIIFEIDTPGGRVDSAGQIGSHIQSITVPTTAYIVNEALSAGSYIALFSDNIYFNPHATMGASGIINQDGTAADEKAQSAWLAQMRSAAESNDRDPIYAAAMADNSIDLPEYGAPEGQFLTLGPREAVEVGYAEGIVSNRAELLEELDLSEATIVETETSIAEELARFLTHPVVIPILLSVASIGLIVELYSPGFGIPGILGLVSLVLFFYGHVVAGLAGMEALLLLLIGIGLIVAEFFVTGGILGVLGIAAVIGSLFMSGYDMVHMSMSIGIAFLIAVILAIILFRRIGLNKGIFRHIVLRDSIATEDGYVSSVNRLELVGLEGNSLTPLRPSGLAELNNETIDVVSDGTFVDRGKKVKVIRVEGVRVVVREVK
ncbi:NfeD family protein [Oceanobacillus jeddahense]|uniref:Nodulation protein NfeD n=1 Tax=Oceanobacillus jeddahense TaxID=1462527 RepID=A0ABY5JRY5_9BACI|nr:nodulation protein NfeD [Oceanobacillus jeddahense]UUI01374.1 nodulation protein NfeD [Oceanobacillus jeddahense]